MKIGLCLSGGGARGTFHMGVLKAIDELDIRVSIISGCSAGALVGCLYAAGVKPDLMLDLAIRTRWFSFLKPSIPDKGLMGMDYLNFILKSHIKENDFNALSIPLKVVATNISKGVLVIFDEGEIIKPVLASCSIPVLFKPINIQNQYYLDGGILLNFPARIIRKECDLLIGVSLMPIVELPFDEIRSSFKVLTRVLELSINNNSKLQMETCDIMVESQKIAEFSKYDLNSAKPLFQLGYECGLTSLKGILSS